MCIYTAEIDAYARKVDFIEMNPKAALWDIWNVVCTWTFLILNVQLMAQVQ